MMAATFALATRAMAALCCAAPADADPNAQFQSLFGEDLRRVRATRAVEDDLALAERMLASADNAFDAPALRAVLLRNAYATAARCPGGCATAVRAMKALIASHPKLRCECERSIVSAYRRSYRGARGSARIGACRSLVNSLLTTAERILARDGDDAEALAYYREAAQLARASGWKQAGEIQQTIVEVTAAIRADRRAATLAEKLRADPDNAYTARALLMLHLTARDDPAAAEKLLDRIEPDEQLRSYLPLACRRWPELNKDQCLELARWYERLAGGVRGPARTAMLGRTVAYYRAYLTFHGRSDADAVAVRLKVGKLDRQLRGERAGGFTPPPEGLSEELLAWTAERDKLRGEALVAALQTKIAEVHGRDINLHEAKFDDDNQLRYLDFHEGNSLRNLAPLYGLPLEELKIRRTAVTSLEALTGMPLRRLCASVCDDLTSLRGLEEAKIEYLDLAGSGVTNLLPLKGMTTLRDIRLSNCKRLKSLRGLEGIPLRVLDCHWCSLLEDIEPIRGAPLEEAVFGSMPLLKTIAGLEGMPLRKLILSGTKITTIEPLRGMKLRELSLSSCRGVRDLSPLEGMPLEKLSLSGMPLRDLDALRGLPIKELQLDNCTFLRSLAGAEELPLTTLSLRDTAFANARHAEALKKRIPTLKEVRY